MGLEELVLPEGYRIGYRFFPLPCRLGTRWVWGSVAVVQRFTGRYRDDDGYCVDIDEWYDVGFHDDVIERLRGQGKPVVEPDWGA